MVGVVGGMHTVITNSTHSSKEVIEVSTNGFPKRKKLSGNGPILGVVSNYMQNIANCYSMDMHLVSISRCISHMMGAS